MSDRSLGLRDHLDLATMRAGARAILPLSIGAFPFGLAYGVTVAGSALNDLVGLMASFIVQAGAAQLAISDLLDEGAPWFIVIGTALVINARFMMYSGALAPSFRQYPRRWRIPLAHFMTDQSTVTSLLFNQTEPDPRRRLSYYVGAGVSFTAFWWVGTAIGVAIGTAIPSEFQVGFAAPLMFIALTVPSIRDSAALVAAATAFSVTLIAREAPLNTGLLIGAGVGIAFGMVAASRSGPGGEVAPVPSSTAAAVSEPTERHRGG